MFKLVGVLTGAAEAALNAATRIENLLAEANQREVA